MLGVKPNGGLPNLHDCAWGLRHRLSIAPFPAAVSASDKPDPRTAACRARRVMNSHVLTTQSLPCFPIAHGRILLRCRISIQPMSQLGSGKVTSQVRGSTVTKKAWLPNGTRDIVWLLM